MQSPLDQVLVWDLETIPDLPCVARVNGFDEADEAAAREKLGDKFPKLIFHAIVCIGALIAERVEGVWIVRSLGAPNIAERTEAELIQSFVDRIAEYPPAVGDVQRVELRPAGAPVSGDDQSSGCSWPVAPAILRPLHRGCARSLRRARVLRPARQDQPQRPVPSAWGSLASLMASMAARSSGMCARVGSRRSRLL